MPSLPLKVQLGIRDQWNKDDGPLQTSLKSLKEVLGHDIVVEPEWQLLLAELDKFYSDKGVFVAIVTGCVETWCKSMAELLEDEANEDWTDSLLERLKSRSVLRLFVEVSKNEQASTSWSAERTAFVICLPKKTVHSSADFYPIFRGSLLHAFDEKGGKQDLAHREAAPPADDWADVEMDRTTGKADVIEKSAPLVVRAENEKAGYRVDRLPTANSLPRPDDLFLRPPYHLVVYDMGRQKVEVHCSHSPSLQLLAEYLRKWCRVNHNDTRNPPGVEVLLEQSPWGLGTMYDRLLLTTENSRYTKQFTVNPCIVLALVEGVLGYERASVDGGQWTFRRDVEFM